MGGGDGTGLGVAVLDPPLEHQPLDAQSPAVRPLRRQCPVCDESANLNLADVQLPGNLGDAEELKRRRARIGPTGHGDRE